MSKGKVVLKDDDHKYQATYEATLNGYQSEGTVTVVGQYHGFGANVYIFAAETEVKLIKSKNPLEQNIKLELSPVGLSRQQCVELIEELKTALKHNIEQEMIQDFIALGAIK